MRVAAYQFDVRADDPAGNLERVVAAARAARSDGVELLVVPEMWPTSFTAAADAAAVAASEAAVRTLAAEACGMAVVGSAYADGGGELPVNRAHVLADGAVLAHHDKVHLFSPTAEHLAFSPGDAPPPVVEVAGVRIAPLVCYDLRFPEVARAAFRGGAEVLAVCAQWPVARAGHWAVLAAGRAVEGQCFVVASNRTGSDEVGRRRMRLDFPGNSLVVGPDGRPLAAGAGREGTIVAEIDPDEAGELRRRVPVARDERRDVYRRW